MGRAGVLVCGGENICISNACAGVYLFGYFIAEASTAWPKTWQKPRCWHIKPESDGPTTWSPLLVFLSLHKNVHFFFVIRPGAALNHNGYFKWIVKREMLEPADFYDGQFHCFQNKIKVSEKKKLREIAFVVGEISLYLPLFSRGEGISLKPSRLPVPERAFHGEVLARRGRPSHASPGHAGLPCGYRAPRRRRPKFMSLSS